MYARSPNNDGSHADETGRLAAFCKRYVNHAADCNLYRADSTLSGSMITIIDLFANGMSYGDGEDLEMRNPFGYNIVYMMITVGLFLILAQVCAACTAMRVLR